jgi:hypothetical protein
VDRVEECEAALSQSRGCERFRRRAGNARCGRHAVVRGGAELARAFALGASMSGRPRRAARTVGPAAGGCDRRPPGGERRRRASGAACTKLASEAGPSIRTRMRTRGRQTGPASASRAAVASLANTHDLRDFLGLPTRTDDITTSGRCAGTSSKRLRFPENSATQRDSGLPDGETRTRTGDTTIFRQLHGTLELARTALQ